MEGEMDMNRVLTVVHSERGCHTSSDITVHPEAVTTHSTVRVSCVVGSEGGTCGTGHR